MKISNNPLDYVTKQDIERLGLTAADLAEAYQPSSGGVYHARGAESQGKTLWIAHFYRDAIDSGMFFERAVGNMTFKGKYAWNYETLKGDDLRQFLWDMTHKPYRDCFVVIDEIDSEFPARSFSDKEQTEIALRLWHIAKLGNFVCSSSHKGNSTDLLIHLASHYFIYPYQPDFRTQTMPFDVVNVLDDEISLDWYAEDIVKTMLIYSRKELTENTEEEQNKIRPSLIKKSKRERRQENKQDYINLKAELEALNLP